MLLEAQRAVARALLRGEGEAALALVAPGRLPSGRCLAVHVNTCLSGLVGTLAAAYPAVAAALGEPAFRAVATAFVRRHPPHRAWLSGYGAGFDAFLAHSGAASQPWLPDLARLEWARNEALFAAEAPSLAPAALAALPPAAVASLRLAAHPAARLVASGHPLARLRARLLGEVAPEEEEVGAALLVTRPGRAVLQQPLGAGAAALLAALLAGERFDAAGAAGFAAEPGLALAAALAAALRLGAFTSVLSFEPGEPS